MEAFEPYTREQTRHISEATQAWECHSALLRERAALVGGMQWKTLGGHDYLYRYMPDPLTRKKRSTSLGRRTPETESLYRDFLQRRQAVAEAIERDHARQVMQARMTKALHLARMPNVYADVLRVLWLSGVADHMVLMSSHVLFAFESVFAGSIDVDPDDALEFLVRDDHLLDEVVDDLRLALVGFDKTATLERRRSGLVATGRKIGTTRFTAPSQLEPHIGRKALQAVREMLGYDGVPAMAFSRSGEPVPMIAMDPRAYVVRSLLIDDDVAPEIGLVAALAHRRDQFPFEDEHLDALPYLAEVIENDGMRGLRI